MEVSIVNPSPILKYILCYPKFDEEELRKRIIEAYLLGIRSFIFNGGTEIRGINVIGKGTTSIVVRGKYLREKDIAVKIRRLDSNRDSVINEARMLLMANREGIGPKLVTFSRNFLIWEFISGMSLVETIIIIKNYVSLRKIILDLLKQAYKLDLLGISHKELSRPKDHILVTKDLKVYILDFETASLSSKKSNLTQLMSFLFFRKGKISYLLRSMLKIDDKTLNNIHKLLKEYKYNKKVFIKLIDILKLKN